MQDSKSILVIYHGNCPDGFSAAWACWKKFGDDAEYFAAEYYGTPPDVTGKDVYFVDFSYKRPVMEKIVEAASRVTLIDHHASAIEDLLGDTPLPGLNHYTDVKRSGAVLAWNFMFPFEPVPLFLQYVQDGDLWLWQMDDSKAINAWIRSFDYTFDEWEEISSTELYTALLAGDAIVRTTNKSINALLKIAVRRMEIGGYSVPVVSAPYEWSSEIGHILGENEVFAGSYYDTAEGRKFSLRSSETGMNVKDIAVQYGGGGHPHAAGFTVPRDHVLATW